MEQDHLPCSCDQEVFERVWRRVMPEDRPDCPFTLGEDAAAPPAVQPPAAALPAVVHTAPAGEQAPSRPVVGEEHDVPCLGASSAVYGAQKTKYRNTKAPHLTELRKMYCSEATV